MASYQLALTEGGRGGADAGASARPLILTSVVGESQAILRAVEQARLAAFRRARTVLLVGEPGTGKELLARAIHRAGPDPEAPFLSLSCATIPRALLEAELFGEARGGRDGRPGLLELAGAGTLFLDEVGELPASLQPKLLRAIEEGRVRRVGSAREVEVRCRFVAATTRPVDEIVPEENLREDLLFRLSALRIRVPPVREREGDVPLLVRHFLEEIARDRGLGAREPTPEAMELLEAHTWPGNVRELRSVVRQAARLADGRRIGPEHLTVRGRLGPSGTGVSSADGLRITLPHAGASMERIEAEVVRLTLEMTGGNKSAAARILGWSRPTLHRKVERYGLDRPEEGGE